MSHVQLTLDFTKELTATITEHAEDRHTDTDQLLELIDGGLADLLNGIFDCMEIAEEEIDRAKKRALPEKHSELHRAFTYLRPSPILKPMTPHLYRAHAREILERIAANGSYKKVIEPATDAELCCVFCEMSLRTPLHNDPVHAFRRVFEAIFPQHSHIWQHIHNFESYDGAVDQILDNIRRKCRQSRE